MKIQLKSNEDLTIVTKGGGNIIVPNNTDTSTDKTFATVDQIGPGGGDKANASSLADPYESDHSSAYVVGDYVTHEGTLYKCNSDTSSPPGEWDDNNWDPVAVTDEMGGGGITGVKLNGTAITPDAQGAVDVLAVPWTTDKNGGKTAVSIGSRSSGDVGVQSVVIGAGIAKGVACLAIGNQYVKAEGAFSLAVNGSSEGQGSVAVCGGRTINTNGFAQGDDCVSKGITSVAMGRRTITAGGTGSSITGTAHFCAFGWNQSDTYYHTKGDGTFCINPKNGASGFYIGENNLPAVIADNVSDKADIDSPALSGTPTAPTAAAGTNTTQIATTEFVQTAIGDINSVLDAINGEEI